MAIRKNPVRTQDHRHEPNPKQALGVDESLRGRRGGPDVDTEKREQELQGNPRR